jgi:hypothetical protein
METLMVVLLYIGQVFGNLNVIQISLWKFDQYVSITLDLHSFLKTFAHIGSLRSSFCGVFTKLWF